jgi:3-hydroxy acid dehydrogenase / malonic semialdehyde reductase
MPSVENKTVFITGASSGIGAACARLFASHGFPLILSARRKDRLDEIVSGLNTDIHIFQLDVRNAQQVKEKIDSLPPEWAAVDILINNAGLARGLSRLQEGDLQDWEEMIDTNIKGLLYVTRTLLPGMIARGHGHIINIGSIAGHEVYPNGNVYCASKHAVDALTRGIRMDLAGTPIRVSTVDPGLVETEFSVVRFHGDRQRARNVYKGMTPLTAEDIADAVWYCASRPSHVQIAEIILMPTAQRSATLVSRDT